MNNSAFFKDNLLLFW